MSVSPQTSSADAGTSGNRQLTVDVSPSDAENKEVTYAITPSVNGLSVSGSGNITWTDETPAGVYTTTVTTNDGGFTDTHALTLTEQETED